MYLPAMLYGNYNDVRKSVSKLKKKCRGNVELVSVQVGNMDMRRVEQNDLIVMIDGVTRSVVKCAYFPFAFPSVLLFEEGIKSSEIVKWYKEEALKNLWVFLSLITDCHITQYLFEGDYLIDIVNALVHFWGDLTSVGQVYINSLEHCFATKATIETGDGLQIWEKSLMFKKLFRLIGFAEEEVNSDAKILNLINKSLQGTLLND